MSAQGGDQVTTDKHLHAWTGLYASLKGGHVHQCFDRRCKALLRSKSEECGPNMKHEVEQ